MIFASKYGVLCILGMKAAVDVCDAKQHAIGLLKWISLPRTSDPCPAITTQLLSGQ